MSLARFLLQIEDGDDGTILRWQIELASPVIRLLESHTLSGNDELMLVIEALHASNGPRYRSSELLGRVKRWSVDFEAADGRRHLRTGGPGSAWAGASAPPKALDAASSRKVTRCRSILGLVNRALPRGVRDDMLDEWMDDIETAAEEGMPVRRRMASILRSLPVIAWRARRPARAREGGA